MKPARLLWGALALLCAPAAAHAQLPAAAEWRTVVSEHFNVTYTPPLEPLARHAAAAAERARALLLEYVAEPPAGRVDIVLSDNVDFSNGAATPFPSNRIFLYAKPPVDLLELSYVHDWIEFVVVHELAHVFHLDVTSGVGRALRSVFGRVPADWPFFPAALSPGWSTEGLAVLAESRLTGTGRLHGSYHEMVARTAALETGIEDIDRLGSGSPVWPGGQRVYIYGSLFLHDLEERQGAGAVAALVRGTASALVPPSLWYDQVGRRALGTGFRRAYEDWRARATARYRGERDSLAALGVTRTRPLATGGGLAWYPRYSPDGSRIAYAANDRRSTPRLRVIDARTGELAWERRLNGSGAPAWVSDRELLASQLEYVAPEVIHSDLYRMRAGHDERLTRAARLQDVTVARSGRVAAVQSVAGTNRLVLLDAQGGVSAVLRDADPRVHWSLPRWSPDGALLAAGRWSQGGRFDIVLLDPASGAEETIADTGANPAPAWSPDGRFIVFSSDRDGIPNLYAWDRERRTLARLTRLLTGAFHPDVAPDGRSIAFSAYHHDGFHIETMPVDFGALDAAAVPGVQAEVRERAPILTVRADTATGPARPYRALPALAPRYWVPVLVSAAERDFVGVASSGQDLVGRHEWSALLAAAPASGRLTADAWYEYRGLPELGSVKPALTLGVVREWDRILEAEADGDPYIDEREDLLTLGLGLARPRYRSSVGAGLAGEVVRRRRLLEDAPGLVLRDGDDRLLGARAYAAFGNVRRPAFAISAEDGVIVQGAVRQRWDRAPRSFTDSTGAVFRYDGGYREASAWAAGYRSLGRVSFAHAVAALRGSVLVRDGAGASAHGVGGSSGESLALGPLAAGGSEFLPVRGFREGARRGTSAWSAAAEVRVPVALITRRAWLLPVFLDRLSASAFFDAGDASCPAARRCSPARLGEPLLSAGGEAVLDAALLGFPSRLRLGWAVPLQGDHRARGLYLEFGSSF